MELSFRLPYPPTINHYYGRRIIGNRVSMYIKPKGQQYRQQVAAIIRPHTIGAEPCKVSIVAVPPDRRRRDIDNIQKALLDAMEKAGAYDDDTQIMSLTTLKSEPVKGGACCHVWIETIPPNKVLDPSTGLEYL